MSNPNRYQQQSLHRKLLYFGLIVALLSAGWVVRYRTLGFAPGIVQQASRLDLREQDVGEADLSGSTLNLTLTGSRGLVLCLLWYECEGPDGLMARNEWNQLDLRVRLITKLQPHFESPWLFQSWNLAYNVSNEPDRLSDKYYYISRGMDLLGEGVRRNRDNPDLRFAMGTYLLNKFGVADENRTFRCLFQLSCIDPRKRDERRFREPGSPYLTEEGWVNFENFCREHPFLVRRLREELGYDTPSRVIDFLHENRKVACRYEEPADDRPDAPTPLKEPASQFPVLPGRVVWYQPKDAPREDVADDVGELPDSFDGYALARAWFSFANDPLLMDPPRKPRRPAPVIFLGYPARAQAYRAERMEHEGWFDEGWGIDDWFPANPANPRAGQPKSVQLAEPRHWAQDEWQRAYLLYQDYGPRSGMILTPEQEAKLPQIERQHRGTDRMVTNITHWLAVTDVERQPAAVAAHKHFFKAERLRRSGGRPEDVVAEYEHPDAFGPPGTWSKDKMTGFKKLFLDPRFKDYREDTDIQEDYYRIQLRYIDQVRQARGDRLNAAKAAWDLLTTMAAAPFTGQVPQPPVEFGRSAAWPLSGPLDDVDENNQPLVAEMVSNMFTFDPRTYMLPKTPVDPREKQAERERMIQGMGAEMQGQRP